MHLIPLLLLLTACHGPDDDSTTVGPDDDAVTDDDADDDSAPDDDSSDDDSGVGDDDSAGDDDSGVGDDDTPCTGPPALWWPDTDGDGYGDAAATPTPGSVAPPAHSGNGLDCADGDPSRHPNIWLDPAGDGIDADCDGIDGASPSAWALRLHGDGPGQRAGSILTLDGDVDGDGAKDLLLGLPEDDGMGFDAGSARIVFGAALSGWTLGEHSVAAADVVISGLGASDGIGCVAQWVGDIDGDAVIDLLIGERCDTDAATMHLFSGATLVPGTTTDVSGAFVSVIGDGAAWLTSMAGLGDLDGDGLGELAGGAPEGEGRVWIWSGAALAVGGARTPLDAGTVIEGRSAVGTPCWSSWCNPFLRPERAGDRIRGGFDRDGDGLGDLLVSAPSAADGIIVGGAAYVFPGSLLAAGGTLSTANAALTVRGSDFFTFQDGAFEVVSDLDGDGRPEICFTDEDVWGTTTVGILSSTNAASVRTFATLDARILGAAKLGETIVGGGDLDGDGVAELILGEDGGVLPSFPAVSGRDHALLWLLHDPMAGGPVGTQVAWLPSTSTFLHDAPLRTLEWRDLESGLPGVRESCGEDCSTGVGAALAVGDWNGDGLLDLAVGVPDEGGDDPERGAIWLLPNPASTLPVAPTVGADPCDPGDDDSTGDDDTGDDDSAAPALPCAAGLLPWPGDRLIRDPADAEAFCTSWNAVSGALSVNGPAMADTDALSCLCEVGGTLYLTGSQLSDASFPSLTQAGGLRVVWNDTLATLSMPNLGSAGGNVEIGDNPALGSFSGLSSLAEVGQILWLSGNGATSTADLAALTTVGLNIVIQGPALTNIDLPALSFVGYQMTLYSAAPGVTMGPFASLQSLDILNLMAAPPASAAVTFSALETVDTLYHLGWLSLLGFSLPVLETVGWMTVSPEGMSSLELPSLTTAGSLNIGQSSTLQSLSLPSLQSAGVGLGSLSALQTVSLPALVDAEGVWVTNCDLLSALDLPALVTADEIDVNSSSLLSSVSAPNLASAGVIDVLWLPALDMLSFPMLTVADDLTLYDLPLLADVNGFPSLTSLGTLAAQGLDTLEDFSGFVSLPDVTDDVWIRDCPSLLSLDGLDGVTQLSENVQLWNLPTLTSLDALSGLVWVGADLSLHAVGMSDLGPLSALAGIGGDLVVQSCPSLSDFQGLSSLTSVGGDVAVGLDPSLTSASGLDGLRTVGGNLRFISDPLLADISALGGVQSVGGYFQAANDASLSTAHVQAVLAQIGTGNIVGGVFLTGLPP